MGKVKIKKKDTRIDMTAMSDVTVLLLTFFMLTSSFLSKEPVQVITPPAVSEEKVPDEKAVSVLVSPEGRVYLSLIGTKDSTMVTEQFRKEVLSNAVAIWNDKHPSQKVQLNQKEVETFTKLGSFGVPFSRLKEWLDMDMEKRDKALEVAGIPINLNKDVNGSPNEFQIWMVAARNASNDAGFGVELRQGKGVAIKADQTTKYEIISVVMQNLQTVNLNKFSLMTALKSVED